MVYKTYFQRASRPQPKQSDNKSSKQSRTKINGLNNLESSLLRFH